MLIHYFGSKEQLIGEVMAEIQVELQSAFAALTTDLPPNHHDHLLKEFWKILSDKKNLPSLRLLFEVQMLALQNPKRYRRYVTESSASWRRLIEHALPGHTGMAAPATFYNAVIDGLLLELLSTGDKRRTTAALGDLIGCVQPPSLSKRKRH